MHDLLHHQNNYNDERHFFDDLGFKIHKNVQCHFNILTNFDMSRKAFYHE